MSRNFDIIALKHVSGISQNSDKNIWEQQSTCYPIVLKFHILKKEIFPNCICLGLMEN